MKRTTIIAVFACMAALACASANAQEFHILGSLTTDGRCKAHGVSVDGRYIVGTSSSYDYTGGEAVRWDIRTPSLPIGLGDPSVSSSWNLATAVSADGSVVVGHGLLDMRPQAFIWDRGTTTWLGCLDGDDSSWALDVSDDGSIVVGKSESSEPKATHGFRWTTEGMAELKGPRSPYADVIAYAVSGDGAVIAGRERNFASIRAVRWLNEGTESCEGTGSCECNESCTCNGSCYLPGIQEDRSDAEARGVSVDGSLIVGFGSSDHGSEAVIWDCRGEAVQLVALGELNSANTTALAVSTDGSTVVGGTKDRAFIWRSGGNVQDLNSVLELSRPDGWVLESAEDISASGHVVVGYGKYLNETGAWYALFGSAWQGGASSWDSGPNWDAGVPSDLAVVNSGTAQITSGTHAVDKLCLSESASTTGTTTLSGGSLTTNETLVGLGGTGVFRQSGGMLTVNGPLHVGWSNTSDGTVSFDGGTMVVEQLKVGALDGGGAFNLDSSGAADTVTVSDTFELGAGASFTAAGGSTITMEVANGAMGRFINRRQRADGGALGGLGNLTLICQFGQGDAGQTNVIEFEVAGITDPTLANGDFGDEHLFVMDTLVVGRSDALDGECGVTLRLVNNIANGNGAEEALIVRNLDILAGGRIALGTEEAPLKLYYLHEDQQHVIQFIPADIDLDGDVDLDDFVILKKNFGKSPGAADWSMGDLDADRDVDLDDVVILKKYFSRR